MPVPAGVCHLQHVVRHVYTNCQNSGAGVSLVAASHPKLHSAPQLHLPLPAPPAQQVLRVTTTFLCVTLHTQVTTEEQRTSFREELTDAEDWLYGDGEHEDAAGYRKKLSELSTTGQPMTKRRQELEMRPRVGAGGRGGGRVRV